MLRKRHSKFLISSSESEEENVVIYEDGSSDDSPETMIESDNDESGCRGCGSNKTRAWIQCELCNAWWHRRIINILASERCGI